MANIEFACTLSKSNGCCWTGVGRGSHPSPRNSSPRTSPLPPPPASARSGRLPAASPPGPAAPASPADRSANNRFHLKLWGVAKALFGSDKAHLVPWADARCDDLDEGRLDGLLATLRAHADTCEEAALCANYT